MTFDKTKEYKCLLHDEPALYVFDKTINYWMLLSNNRRYDGYSVNDKRGFKYSYATIPIEILDKIENGVLKFTRKCIVL